MAAFSYCVFTDSIALCSHLAAVLLASRLVGREGFRPVLYNFRVMVCETVIFITLYGVVVTKIDSFSVV